MTQFNYYSDPGHGWVRVPKKLLRKLGIDAQITHYSYMRGSHAYLEEDCDLTLFETAMEKIGKDVTFKQYFTNRDSKIRNYDSYLKTWDTDEVQKDFEIISFAAPYVVVVHRATNVKGCLSFNHLPRYYFDFKPF